MDVYKKGNPGNLPKVKFMETVIYTGSNGYITVSYTHLSADERLLREAEKMLYDEIAMVLHIKPDQVVSYISRQLPAEDGERKETVV